MDNKSNAIDFIQLILDENLIVGCVKRESHEIMAEINTMPIKLVNGLLG
jgi:hypothetical protein